MEKLTPDKINDAGQAAKLALSVVADIDSLCNHAFPMRHSHRLSPSSLGHTCAAHLWFKFRWATLEEKEGRIKRLFNVGNREEPLLINYLRETGWAIRERDEKGKQFSISGAQGHLYGKVDGLGSHNFYTADQEIVIEAKTFNKKYFAALIKDTLKLAKYEYYVQLQFYMHYLKKECALIICVCKDDSQLYVEFVPYHKGEAEAQIRRAEEIRDAQSRPPRISQSPAFHVCKICEFINICHFNETPDKSCRSCISATAVPDGKFFCNRYNDFIPREFEPLGCDHWEKIT